jgi:hypothetical protein
MYARARVHLIEGEVYKKEVRISIIAKDLLFVNIGINIGRGMKWRW